MKFRPVALLVLAWSAFVFPAPASTRYMPIDEVQPGMTGVGRTVFKGTAIEEFRVHVLGVVRSNIGPRRDLILARLEGGPLASTGVIAGMSGSPVYIDGRLVGAVSYSLGTFATEPIAGATFYITLEPCSHHGRTPPCVDALIACRPGRVVVGTTDPNPKVSGKGIQALERRGIETTVGVLAEACRQLNEVFFKYIRTGIPFVTVKFAQTLDGRIATATGHSRWISSPPSLRFAHRLRSLHDAILVGSGTVLADNPELTCRLVRGRNPLRIVVDSRLRSSPEARIFQETKGARTITAPTIGFGLTLPSPFRANRSAMRIKRSSVELVFISAMIYL